MPVLDTIVNRHSYTALTRPPELCSNGLQAPACPAPHCGAGLGHRPQSGHLRWQGKVCGLVDRKGDIVVTIVKPWLYKSGHERNLYFRHMSPGWVEQIVRLELGEDCYWLHRTVPHKVDCSPQVDCVPTRWTVSPQGGRVSTRWTVSPRGGRVSTRWTVSPQVDCVSTRGLCLHKIDCAYTRLTVSPQG